MEKVAHNSATVKSASEMEMTLTELTMEKISCSPIINLARKFNTFILNRSRMESCKPFVIDGFQVGLITPEVFDKLLEYPDVFCYSDGCVHFVPTICDYETRSKAVDSVLREFRQKGTFITLNGWRDECYEVRVDFMAGAVMKMERAATCLFGIRQYGVDINGYVNHPELGLCLWLQKRSKTKQRWPGMMDNIVGGGLSVGYSVPETAHKEAGEEASIPPEILQKLEPIGTVSIFFESERGISANTEFVFDLELPLDFVPVNQDGEVSEFHLYPILDAFKVIMSPDFKTTSCPVALDFLVRRGIINEGNEPDLNTLKELLHIPLRDFYRPFRTHSKSESSSSPGETPALL